MARITVITLVLVAMAGCRVGGEDDGGVVCHYDEDSPGLPIGHCCVFDSNTMCVASVYEEEDDCIYTLEEMGVWVFTGVPDGDELPEDWTDTILADAPCSEYLGPCGVPCYQ